MNEQGKDEVVLLNLDDIIPNRFQPREIFDERALKELAVSIKEHGVIQPIIVRNVNGKYEIIAGERRYKAAALAGLTKIPAIIRNLDDKESSKVALLENLQRKNLNAVEEARTYQKILEIDEMTQDELAKTMGKSQSAVANKIRLLSLPDEVQEALLKEQISERHARSLLNVPDSSKQKELLKKVINEKISVRKLEEEINELYPKPKKAEEIPIAEEEIPSANKFLNNKPLTPTGVDIEEQSDNYGKVIVAPPQEEGKGRFINYGEISKELEEKQDKGFELPDTATQVDIEKVKEEAESIPKTDNNSEIDGLLNIGAPTLSGVDKIEKDLIAEEKDQQKIEDYFKAPDLNAIQITEPIEENKESEQIRVDSMTKEESIINQSISIDAAKEKIKAVVEELKTTGISINADEMDFPGTYQVIIKIDK